MRSNDEGATRSSGSTGARSTTRRADTGAPAASGATPGAPVADVGSTTRQGTAAELGATGSASGSAPSSRVRSSSRSANASADNILPSDEQPYTLADPIYGQPGGPVLARSDRTEREEILRRRLTPEQFDAVMQQRDAEAAAAQSSSESGTSNA